MMRQQFAITGFFKSAARASPLLWWSALLMVVGLVVCLGLQLVDDRMIAGVNVWEKPAKFFLSLIVLAITMAWAISLLPKPARGVVTASCIYVVAGWLEMAYIIFRASRGEASHFNVGTTLSAILYPLMGLFAVSLLCCSAVVGWRVWQQRDDNLMRQAAGLGLMLGAALGALGGAYLSSHSSHWIGGDQTDATGLAFFHWSTTGGDLRVSHFIGLHAAQFLPVAALSNRRWLVYGVAVFLVLATAAAFAGAVMGVPLLRI